MFQSIPVEMSQRIPVNPERQIHRKPPPGTDTHDPPFRHGLVRQTVDEESVVVT